MNRAYQDYMNTKATCINRERRRRKRKEQKRLEDKKYRKKREHYLEFLKTAWVVTLTLTAVATVSVLVQILT